MGVGEVNVDLFCDLIRSVLKTEREAREEQNPTKSKSLTEIESALAQRERILEKKERRLMQLEASNERPLRLNLKKALTIRNLKNQLLREAALLRTEARILA